MGRKRGRVVTIRSLVAIKPIAAAAERDNLPTGIHQIAKSVEVGNLPSRQVLSVTGADVESRSGIER